MTQRKKKPETRTICITSEPGVTGHLRRQGAWSRTRYKVIIETDALCRTVVVIRDNSNKAVAGVGKRRGHVLESWHLTRIGAQVLGEERFVLRL